MNSDNKSPITLEALMRLKRMEQPAPEFWTQFDKELRAKQLTAILEKRPWWHSFPRAYGMLSRHPMAFGTAAALTVALFSVNEYRGNRYVSSAISADEVAYAPAAFVAPIHSEAPVAVPVAAPAPERTAVAATPVVSAKASDDTFGQEVASMISSPQQMERNERLEPPSGRSLAAINLAAIQAAEPELTRNTLGLSQNFSGPSAPDLAQMTEPLAQMASPSEESRSRLMAEGLPVMASLESPPAPSNDNVASRLSDDRVYESISRYDLAGNRLSIKF